MMMRKVIQFIVNELGPSGLAAAWPLVRSASTHLNQVSWESSARSLIDRGGGVLAVSTRNAPILGIATYEAVHRPYLGKTLQVETLITFELTSRASVRKALCDALDQLAFAEGCGAVTVALPGRGFMARARERVAGAIVSGLPNRVEAAESDQIRK